MVVIAVLGILASIAVTNVSGAQASARDAQRKADLSSYHLAIQRYYAANAIYPVGDDFNGYKDVSAPPTGIFRSDGALVTSGYMAQAIPDPSSQVNPDLHYRYLTDSRGFTYVLYARLEAGQNTWWIQRDSGITEASSLEPTSP